MIPSVVPAQACEQQWQLDIFRRGEDRDEVERLEDEAHLLGAMLRAGVNPQGLQVVAFGKPSTEELEPFLRRACDEPATSTGRRPFFASSCRDLRPPRSLLLHPRPRQARLDRHDT